LDLWIFGSLDLWIFGSLDLWIFGSLDLWIFYFYRVRKFFLIGIPGQVGFVFYVGVQKMGDSWHMSLAPTIGASGAPLKNSTI
jgi:hypothetical protein